MWIFNFERLQLPIILSHRHMIIHTSIYVPKIYIGVVFRSLEILLGINIWLCTKQHTYSTELPHVCAQKTHTWWRAKRNGADWRPARPRAAWCRRLCRASVRSRCVRRRRRWALRWFCRRACRCRQRRPPAWCRPRRRPTWSTPAWSMPHRMPSTTMRWPLPPAIRCWLPSMPITMVGFSISLHMYLCCVCVFVIIFDCNSFFFNKTCACVCDMRKEMGFALLRHSVCNRSIDHVRCGSG